MNARLLTSRPLLAAATLCMLCTAATPALASADEPVELSSFLVNVEVGVSGGWLNGLVASAAGMAGGRGQYLRFGVRTTGGATDSGNVGWDVGGELGWRMVLNLGGSAVSLLVGLDLTATHMQITDTYYNVSPYRYAVFGARASLGVMFGRGARIRHGVYLTGEGGYSDHLNSNGENKWGEDYSQSTGRGGVRYSVTF